MSSVTFPPSSAFQAVCPLVHRLYSQSPLLRLLFLAQSVGSVLALVVLAFGMLQICTRQPGGQQMPVGTLLMLLNLCVALLLANVGALLSSLYHLHVPLLRAPSAHCYWLSFSLSDCLMIRTILNVALFATYMAGACLALERMLGSLLLIRRAETKRAVAVFLALIQWLLSAFAALPPSLSSSPAGLLSPHCSMLTPSPTQLRPLFFASLGMQAFSLAIFSILTYHNHFDPQVTRELSRRNALLLEQVHATEQALPAAATVVGLFLASTFLDRQFLLALASAFVGHPGGSGGWARSEGRAEQMFRTAFWSEFQILAIPLMSLLLVAILQVQARSQRIAEEDIYERVGGSANSAANVIAVRKVPSALAGEAEDSDPYEKTSPSTSSSSEGGDSEERSSGGRKKPRKSGRGGPEGGDEAGEKAGDKSGDKH